MKTSYQRILLLLLATALWTLTGTSCNTVRGMGRDVERTGEGIQQATR